MIKIKNKKIKYKLSSFYNMMMKNKKKNNFKNNFSLHYCFTSLEMWELSKLIVFLSDCLWWVISWLI